MNTIHQYIQILTEYPKLPLLIILPFIFLKWQGGEFFILTPDGRRLLNIEKELRKRFQLKRSPSLWNLLCTASNQIVIEGKFKNKSVSNSLINSYLFRDPVLFLKSDISSHLKGTSVIVKANNRTLEFSSESMTSKDVTSLLEKLCS